MGEPPPGGVGVPGSSAVVWVAWRPWERVVRGVLMASYVGQVRCRLGRIGSGRFGPFVSGGGARGRPRPHVSGALPAAAAVACL